ncbi:MAG: hypothetical protein OXC29_26130 [Rhodococcus sp.]|nr:hypothetical protein [Rhodococcus sp. (in: high G+C Gram-positive bacteria)]
MVVELANALGRRQDDRPLMLMAGDSGQTVRPTGFEWTPLTEHVSKPQRGYAFSPRMRVRGRSRLETRLNEVLAEFVCQDGLEHRPSKHSATRKALKSRALTSRDEDR